MSRAEEQLRRLREAERAAGRAPGSVTLVGASKTRTVEEVRAAWHGGIRHFGENYAQELEAKATAIPEAGWHFIGHLQRNKARVVASLATRLHALDSARLADALAVELRRVGRRLPVLIEVNVAGEASKSGCRPEDVPAIIEAACRHPELDPDGLMTLPPDDGTPEVWFSALRSLRDEVAARMGRPLPELSMGMSGDLEAAVACGATFVRVGTALFGPRERRPRPEGTAS